MAVKNDNLIKHRAAKYIWAFEVVFALSFTLLIWVIGPNLEHFIGTLIFRNDV